MKNIAFVFRDSLKLGLEVLLKKQYAYKQNC
jgi:hypothetical protein